MKFLSSPEHINKEMNRLIKHYRTGSWAVAWASINFDCYNIFSAHKRKFERIIIGTHFYQTHPDFIKSVIGDSNIRFDMNPGGVFHPKLYLFENNPKDWECIIGSPNFTKSAFKDNSETAMLISNIDVGSDDVYKDIKSQIDDYWKKAEMISKVGLIKYENMWKRKQKPLKNLSGRYDDLDKPHKSPIDIEMITMTWGEYLSKIEKDKDYLDRIKLIESARDLFERYEHFKDISLDDRKKIAGLMKSKDAFDWRLFGNMIPARDFKKEIVSNNIHISEALDLIPQIGKIAEFDFNCFIKEIKKAFPTGGLDIATATRLLAMKRPDYFLCLSRKNEINFYENFDMKRPTLNNYWDTVVERIIDCEWWNSGKPTKKVEVTIWNGRAAFLDGLLYKK